MAKASLKPTASELVIGVVCLVGTDSQVFVTAVSDHVKKFKYNVGEIRVSNFLAVREIAAKHKVPLKAAPEGERIRSAMDAGNKVREISGRQDILALYAASAIATGRVDESPRRTVHVILSLKRPEEIAALRALYGDGFYLVGLYSSETSRLAHFVDDKNVARLAAKKLMERDQEESAEFGQRTRDTFELADVFLDLAPASADFKSSVYRFLDLLFGDPFQTPTRAENAMFLAYSASLRSADLSRQVGAVVVSASGEVIATGANDVPCWGGGLYWPGESDKRDHVLGRDTNKTEIRAIAREIAREVRPGATKAELRDIEEKVISNTRLGDLTEFGRPVHAEMEALLHCARVGVSPADGEMFVTTFPCHNCAKHIVGAGIKRLYFVEAYPKSRALESHKDALVLGDDSDDANKVVCRPFVGVAARRYFDLFSLKLSSGVPLKRKSGDKKKPFAAGSAIPRVPMPMTSVWDREKLATKIISETMR